MPLTATGLTVTLPMPQMPGRKVVSFEKVPSETVRLSSLPSDETHSPQQVRSTRHRFEVLGIHAGADTAQVVDL